MKPGWQTTEFWTTAAVSVVGLLAAIGLLKPEDRPGVEGALQTAIVSVFGFISAVVSLWRYIASRSEVKVAELNAQAKVLTESTNGK